MGHRAKQRILNRGKSNGQEAPKEMFNILWCFGKSPTQICPSNENTTQLIWIHAVRLDWADLLLHYHLPHLWDPLELAVSPGHVLLLCFSSSSFISVSSPSSIFSFSSPSHLPLHPPPCYLTSHQLSLILQIKMGSSFTRNHLSADSFLVCSHSQKNRNNIK